MPHFSCSALYKSVRSHFQRYIHSINNNLKAAMDDLSFYAIFKTNCRGKKKEDST